MFGGLLCHEFGYGSLITCCCQGKGECQNGVEQLVDAHSFLAEKFGKINSIIKADQTTDEPGYGKNHGAHDKGMTFYLFHFSPEKCFYPLYSTDAVDRTGTECYINGCIS